MRVFFHKNFKKQYKKLPKKIQVRFNERLTLYLKEKEHPLLNVHALQGDNVPLISLNVGGDYRALFVQEKNAVTFHCIGTHSELY